MCSARETVSESLAFFMVLFFLLHLLPVSYLSLSLFLSLAVSDVASDYCFINRGGSCGSGHLH